MTEQTDTRGPVIISDVDSAQAAFGLPPRPEIPLIDVRPVVMAIVGTILLFLAIGVLWGPMIAAKILVSLIMFAVGMVCLAIFFLHRLIMIKLMELEHMGYQIRDDALAHMAAGRAGLEKLNQRLSGQDNNADPESSMPELLKTIAPLVMFAIKKEKSLIRWGMTGLKIARHVSSIFKDKSR